MADLRLLQQEIHHLQEENKALKEEVVAYRAYLSSLHHLVNAVEKLDPNAEVIDLLDNILRNAMKVMDARDGSLLILDEQSNELVFVLAHGDVPQERIQGMRIPPGKGIAGWVAEHKRPTIVNSASSDDRFYSGIDRTLQFQTHSVLAVPIMGTGRVLGVVEVLNKRSGAPFTETDQMLLSLLCRFAGEVLYTVTQRDEAAQPQQEPAAPPQPPSA